MIVINDREKACLIRSAVAGLSSWNSRLAPLSFLALLTASFMSRCHFILYLYFKTTLMAQKTDAARKRGGSPTALLEYTALGFDAPLKIQLGNHTPRHCCRCHCLPEQADIELGRHVIEAWDLVSAWTSR